MKTSMPSALCGALVLYAGAAAGGEGKSDSVETLEFEAMPVTIVAEPFDQRAAEAARPSAAEIERLHEHLLEIREAVASRPENEPFGRPARPGVIKRQRSEAETTRLNQEAVFIEDLPFEPAVEDFPPEDLIVLTNRINTVTPTSGSILTLGEPAHANRGASIFYTGNRFASFSFDGGNTWQERSFPAPPFAGAVMCCDQDVEYSQGRNRVFWSLLWLNSAVTVGEVQIAVLPSPIEPPLCHYNLGVLFDPNVVPDYPHVGLSNDFLYLSTNNIDTNGTSNKNDDTWVGSQMFRFNLDEMAACEDVVASAVFTWFGPGGVGSPQRVFVPVEGATDVMYWGFLDDNTTFRIFEAPNASSSVPIFTRTISFSPDNNPDCRGGINSKDWIGDPLGEHVTAFSLHGFRVRGWVGQANGGGGRHVIGWMWNAGTDDLHPQGHVHAAVFDTQTKDLIDEPHIWNPDFCFGYPDVAVTERGHPAVVLGVGGAAGGGSAVNTAVLLGDDTVVGGGPFGFATSVAQGTHNPDDERFGDYLTIQQYEPCDLYMTASSYVLNGGIFPSNVEHQYTIFGRNRDRACIASAQGTASR